MIDLDKFYKFEVGIGVTREHMDAHLMAYILTPDGEKIVGSSQCIHLLEDDGARVGDILQELMAYLFRSASEILIGKVELYEQHEEAN